jgi:hypothetical protein
MNTTMRKAVLFIAVLFFLVLFRDWMIFILSHCLIATITMLVYSEIRIRMLYRRRMRYEEKQL